MVFSVIRLTSGTNLLEFEQAVKLDSLSFFRRGTRTESSSPRQTSTGNGFHETKGRAEVSFFTPSSPTTAPFRVTTVSPISFICDGVGWGARKERWMGVKGEEVGVGEWI